jgi:uncharacterized iron-regulated membrane protein
MARQSNPGPKLAVLAGAEAEDHSFTSQTLSVVTVAAVGDIFDFENLLPELILALGLALVIGNSLAWWKNRRGEAPEGVDEAQYRPGRVAFLSVVGLLLTVWGAVTLLT